ncbi:hypothetical protein BGW36DRAFT_1811 [Talaromyces proteolyticus]|uniref:Zn(2)-C6 fungal-type domain-containing protein n=1 Tax=Talaromyces proteolyticus TaxID=1131652 RepID=A0AAD4L2I8_9EURO|nr:uncharacterized protein BGW36DRAFT_1811 [Talaromyces proteolyticus]KAH8704783.1 hypothetical protein BGW36DRAFT_1811 [Talaromyces proteolyticus]
MGRKTRACVPCHERKVRCDAEHVGIPCSRCAARRWIDSCIPLSTVGKNQRHHRAKGQRAQTTVDKEDQTSESISYTPNQSQNIAVLTELDTNKVYNDMPNPAMMSIPTPPFYPARYTASESHQLQINSNGTERLTEDPTPRRYIPEREMIEDTSQSIQRSSPTTRNESSNAGDSVTAYQEGTSSISILKEALGHSAQSQLANSILQDTPKSTAELDDVDMEYLRRKGAYSLPPPAICDEFIRLFFERVYSYAPVFDRIIFAREYRQQNVSMFLLQAVLASVTPHVPLELLNSAGFSDHLTAQTAFFIRARLLHDVGVEKNQLRLLQGSLFLSLPHVTRDMDKDYRYWISNAARLAVKIGLYQNIRLEGFDISSKKVLRRIWWVVHSWDTLLALHGLDAARRFEIGEFDVQPLTESDWEEGDIPPDLQDLLPQITRLQKCFLIESGKLQFVVGRFWNSHAQSPISASEYLESSMTLWRQSLPDVLKAAEVQEWNRDNMWVLYLRARCYVCECVMYRMLRGQFSSNSIMFERMDFKLRTAMFELDTTIDRISIHKVSPYCPWFVYTCACTSLALHIEKAMDPTIHRHEKLLHMLRLHSELEFLRDLSKLSSLNKWSLQMFEKIIRATGLSISVTDSSIAEPHAQNAMEQDNQLNGTDDNTSDEIDMNSGFSLSDLELPFDFQFGPLGPTYVLGNLVGSTDQDANHFYLNGQC